MSLNKRVQTSRDFIVVEKGGGKVKEKCAALDLLIKAAEGGVKRSHVNCLAVSRELGPDIAGSCPFAHVVHSGRLYVSDKFSLLEMSVLSME